MTLQSGNKSHTKLFPLHWSCLARSRWCSDSERPLYPLSSHPPSQCEHSHATPSQIQLPSPFRRSRYLPQGQSSSRHCTLSCAQIRNPNPNPFSINDAQTDARPTSDLRAQARSPSILHPPFPTLRCLRFSLWPLWRARLGHCRPLLLLLLLLLMIRLCCRHFVGSHLRHVRGAALLHFFDYFRSLSLS